MRWFFVGYVLGIRVPFCDIKKTGSILFLITAISLSFGSNKAIAQNVNSDELMYEAQNNLQQMHEFPEMSYSKAVELESISLKSKVINAEMWSLITQCEYLERSDEFSRLYVVAQRFYNQSRHYNEPVFQAIACYYLYHNYFNNEMYERALAYLDEGILLLKDRDANDYIAARINRNLLTAYSNYYAAKKHYDDQIYYLELIIELAKDIEDVELRNQIFHIHYANLANAHLKSKSTQEAEQFLSKSIAYKEDFTEPNIDFLNYLTAGQIARIQGDETGAIACFQNALAIDNSFINTTNKMELFESIVDTWTDLNVKDSVEYYALKRDAFKSSILTKKNEFLYDLATDKNEVEMAGFPSISSRVLVLSILALLFVLGWWMKNNNYFFQSSFAFQNDAAGEETNEKSHNSNREALSAVEAKDFTKLIHLLEEQNPAFSAYFDDVYPEFSKKIRCAYENVNQPDIEFCQLLKLKLSSKEIANYKYITHKTVQNKKYLIRKKLDLPKNIDLYHWVDEY